MPGDPFNLHPAYLSFKPSVRHMLEGTSKTLSAPPEMSMITIKGDLDHFLYIVFYMLIKAYC
jgi:hypothetical protein